MRPQGDAIGRSAVYSISLKLAEMNPLISQRPRGSNRMTHGRLLDIRRHDAYFAKTRRDLRERNNARAVNTVVVRDQDSHLLIIKRVSDCFWPNDPHIVSTITKPDANHVDAQSQGW